MFILTVVNIGLSIISTLFPTPTFYFYPIFNSACTVIWLYFTACEEGYHGSGCDKHCPYPYYGLNCASRCNCVDKDCHYQFGCYKCKGGIFVFVILTSRYYEYFVYNNWTLFLIRLQWYIKLKNSLFKLKEYVFVLINILIESKCYRNKNDIKNPVWKRYNWFCVKFNILN